MQTGEQVIYRTLLQRYHAFRYKEHLRKYNILVFSAANLVLWDKQVIYNDTTPKTVMNGHPKLKRFLKLLLLRSPLLVHCVCYGCHLN